MSLVESGFDHSAFSQGCLRWARAMSPVEKYCRNCLYNLRGLPENRCPECGSAFDPEDPTSHYLVRGWWRRNADGVAVALGWALVVIYSVLFISSVLPGYRHRDYCRLRCLSSLINVYARLQIYHSDYGTYPPNLDILRDEILMPDRCPAYTGRSDHLGYAYVPGLRHDDPQHWIVLFDAPWCQHRSGGFWRHTQTCNVLYRNGESGSLTKEELADKLIRFIAEFAQDRGHAPTILYPPELRPEA
ncbi:MAG: hypothetical protein JSU86_16310 [Phycisphaerales bacterium]|nr:MAG: hypothetical protein JSU86_16310 [Phycisphaerales bacterium]